MLFLCNIANVERTFEIVLKIEITPTWRYNYINKNVRRLHTHACPDTSTCEVPSEVSRKLQLTLCNNGVVEVSY